MPDFLQPIATSTLYYGDCLEVMATWRQEQVDLIYLDPPFNSNSDYNILFGKKAANGKSAQTVAFRDTWIWDKDAVKRVNRLKARVASPIHVAMEALETLLGPSGMLSYLSYMGERMEACKRILKPSGSIYLHCDQTASHYLKILMDGIFGSDNFRNEIVWQRDVAGKGGKRVSRQWPRLSDSLLYYTRSDDWFYEQAYTELNEAQKKPYRYIEKETGRRYKAVQLGNYSDASIANFVKQGLIHTSSTGKRYKKYYLDVAKSTLGNMWTDIRGFGTRTASREMTGYPTQKPLALLERIINASSKEGDLVLDPFCGCGTTVVAANNLNRRWAGIDISAFAVETVMRDRLQRVGVSVQTAGIPMDMESAIRLARDDWKQFEKWAVNQVFGLAPNDKRGGDGGIDGKGNLAVETSDKRTMVIAQVKGGAVHKDQVRAFVRTMETKKAACGVFISLHDSEITSGMESLATELGTFTVDGYAEEFPRLQFWRIQEWFENDRDRRFLPFLPPMCDPITGEERHKTLYEQGM